MHLRVGDLCISPALHEHGCMWAVFRGVAPPQDKAYPAVVYQAHVEQSKRPDYVSSRQIVVERERASHGRVLVHHRVAPQGYRDRAEVFLDCPVGRHIVPEHQRPVSSLSAESPWVVVVVGIATITSVCVATEPTAEPTR